MKTQDLSEADQKKVADHRKELQTRQGDAWNHLDDYAFKTAAGGLAVSLTLLGLGRDTVTAQALWWMYGAWVFWTTALIFVVVSIWWGALGLRKQIHHIDQGDYEVDGSTSGYLGRATLWLNGFSALCVLVGLVFLFKFAVLNMEASVTNESKLKTGGQAPVQAPAVQHAIVPESGLTQKGQPSLQAPVVAPVQPVAPISPQVLAGSTPSPNTGGGQKGGKE